jgi:hypothetical protein
MQTSFIKTKEINYWAKLKTVLQAGYSELLIIID